MAARTRATPRPGFHFHRHKKMTLSPRKSMLVIGETITLLVIVFIVAHLRLLLPMVSDPSAITNFPIEIATLRSLLVVITCQVAFFFNDLYEWKIIRNKHQTSIRLLESCSYALILLALIYFGLDGIDRILLGIGPSQPPRFAAYKLSIVPAVVVIVLSFIAAYGYRRAFDWTLFRIPIADRLLMIGDGEIARLLESEITERHDPGYEVIGYILPGQMGVGATSAGKPIFGGYESIVSTVKAEGIHRVIVCLPERRGNLPMIELLNCRLQGIKVEEGELLYERITGKIAVAKLRPSYLIFSEGFNRSKFNYIFKRALDLVLAVIGMVLASPICLLTALLIKLESRGPVFFSQTRVGKEGRIFRILKFRSMRQDAEKESGPVWAGEQDPRITRIGAIIRKLRIDEIPQLINILRNDMSFVGPRPERPFFVDELKKDIPFYTERLVVKPGLTGWAQVNYRYGASKDDAVEKLQYDLYYIKNISIYLDIIILFRTIKVVVLGFGAR